MISVDSGNENVYDSRLFFLRYLISQGADKDALTDEEEKAVDLVDSEDYKTISVLLNTQESVEKERRMSAVPPGLAKKIEPAWFRRESMQRESVLDSNYIKSKVSSPHYFFPGCYKVSIYLDAA